MSQVSRAETSGRATSHRLGLVSAPHKPLPARSWHHQPEAPGGSTAPVSAAPPAPVHPQPAANPPPAQRRGQESTCPGEGATGWGTTALETNASPPPAKPRPGCSQILGHCNLTVLTSSVSAYRRGRNRGARLVAPHPFSQGWAPAAPVSPRYPAGRTERALALESGVSEKPSVVITLL